MMKKTQRHKIGICILACALFRCKDPKVYNNQNTPPTEIQQSDILKDPIQQQQNQKGPTRGERIQNIKKIMDSINKKAGWKKLHSGLWKNKHGAIGFKTTEGTEEGVFITRYITQLCCEGIQLKDQIDTASFKHLGSSFYKDKKNIYTHYAMADGGDFWIVEEAHHATFSVLGDCYAKDKNHIYGERAMVMDSIDYKTFKTKKGIGCFAKDKNGYYFWDDKFLPSQNTAPESLKIIKELDK